MSPRPGVIAGGAKGAAGGAALGAIGEWIAALMRSCITRILYLTYYHSLNPL